MRPTNPTREMGFAVATLDDNGGAWSVVFYDTRSAADTAAADDEASGAKAVCVMQVLAQQSSRRRMRR